MFRYRYSWLLLFATLLTTCKKKEYPESVVINDPVYYASMEIEGRGLKINAGEGDYYMYSSCEHDSDMIYTMNSTFAKPNCDNCGERIEFELRDIDISVAGSPVKTDSVLAIGLKEAVRKGRTPAYLVTFNASNNKVTLNTNFEWDFGDGSTATGALTSHSYESSGPFAICVKAKSNNGCQSTACNVLTFGKTSLQGNISHQNKNDSITLTATILGGAAPYTYFWEFGDGTSSTNAKPTHVYSRTGSYPVSVLVKDVAGKTTRLNYNLVTQNDGSSCAVNYSLTSVSQGVSGSQNFGKHLVRYFDGKGNEYTTDMIDQASDERLEIVSVNDAGVNQRGEKIKKVLIRFNLTLSNGIQQIKFTKGEAVIAVAYK